MTTAQTPTTLGALADRSLVITDALAADLAEYGRNRAVVAEYQETPFGRYLLGWDFPAIEYTWTSADRLEAGDVLESGSVVLSVTVKGSAALIAVSHEDGTSSTITVDADQAVRLPR